MLVVLVIAATLLLCWLIDKGFEKLFRNKPQHVSGKSVRLNKYYGVGGLLLTVLGVSAGPIKKHMFPTTTKKLLRQFQTYAMRYFSTCLKIWIKTLSKGSFYNFISINNHPLGACRATIGYNFHY